MLPHDIAGSPGVQGERHNLSPGSRHRHLPSRLVLSFWMVRSLLSTMQEFCDLGTLADAVKGGAYQPKPNGRWTFDHTYVRSSAAPARAG